MGVLKNMKKLKSNSTANEAANVAQLRAEEKWLVKALADIKHERHCLQVERLHLESLQALIESGNNETSSKKTGEKAVPEKNTLRQPNTTTEIEVPPMDTETYCNDEGLDLAVSESNFDQVDDYSMDEDDDDSCDNLVIDMNMLMNGSIDSDSASQEDSQ